jgi:hypothetical protein
MSLKKTSETLVIGASVSEAVAGTMAQTQVNLSLDPLNNEIFVIQAINMDPQAPENIAGTSTRVGMSLSSTSRATFGSLGDSNVLAVARTQIQQGAGTIDGAPFQRAANESYQAEGLKYIGLIATDDFFIQIEGSNNANTKTGSVKVYGYRAKADSATYAALVQSELLTS